MHIQTEAAHRTSRFALTCIILFLIALGSYVIVGLQDSARMYEDVQVEQQKPLYGGSIARVEFPGSEGTLTIPSWELFRPGDIWSLVSVDNPLEPTYTPHNLMDLTLPHGDSEKPMRAQARIQSSLAELFKESDTSGYPLMISSAYRSIPDQQVLYEDFVQTQGQAAADRYVADPGASEHHTGLAIDLSDTSSTCALDSNRCSLSIATGVWLADNAYRYGFILRYPEGKQPITGIPYEPWHYRYVGIPLAKKIYESGLTLDEALRQMRPAFAR